MPSDDELDELIEQISVDAHGDEGYWSFLQAFTDGIQFPIPATLAGIEAVLSGVDFDGNERRGVVAIIQRGDRSATASLLDIEVPASEQTATQLLAAYKRWLGVT
jgi:hypothetical protein